MGFDDRQYNRRPPQAPPPNIFGQSFSIGTYLGVRVSIHITFLIYIAFELTGSRDIAENARYLILLFASVLLHEFGHSLSCRAVGGNADDIILWPMGGLALCDPPHRPGAQFITTLCGPLVNVLICAACYGSLLAWLGKDGTPIWFNGIWAYTDPHPSSRVYILSELFRINYYLGLFNVCLVFYPFDGGRLVQETLWKLIGYYRSMLVATVLGMTGAILVAALGVADVMQGGPVMLIFIGGFGFITCLRQFQRLREARLAHPRATVREFDDMLSRR